MNVDVSEEKKTLTIPLQIFALEFYLSASNYMFWPLTPYWAPTASVIFLLPQSVTFVLKLSKKNKEKLQIKIIVLITLVE